MRKFIMLASAAAMGIAMPAIAKPGQAGAKAKANVHASGAVSGGKARTDIRANTRATARTGAAVDRRLDSNANGIPDFRERTLADANHNGIADYRERRMVDTNGNGIADYNERLIDRNRDGVDDRAQNRYGGGACPPGLAKKTPACIPPGQAKQQYAAGQRLPLGYRYVAVPQQYVSQIPNYDPNLYRYYYGDNRVYVVDPRTSLIDRVVNLIR